MPCVYDESPEEKAAALQKEMKKLSDLRKEQLDLTTDMLCRVMGFIEANTGVNLQQDLLQVHPTLSRWWDGHKEADRRRQAIEAAESELKQAEEKLRKLREED